MKEVQRHSLKRDAVLSLLQSVTCHPSAEWLYARLKKSFPKISLATVYRNLNQLCECGEAIRIDVGDGTVRYDAQTFDHTHFFCTACHAVEDLGGEEFAGVETTLEEKFGVRICSRSVVFYGLCRNCNQKDKIKGEKS